MQISPSPSLSKSEDDHDRDPMLMNLPKTEKTESVARHIKNQSTWASNKPFAQSKSGIRKANELVAKERAFKSEYISPDALLPSGINNIEHLKSIRQSQKNHKTKPRSAPVKFDDEKVCIEKMIISADSNFIIVGTLDGTIIIYDIQQNQVHYRFEKAHQQMICSLTFGGKENRYLISSSEEGLIKFFDWMGKTETNHSINTHQSLVLHTSTDLYLATADDEKKITLYNLTNFNSKPLHTFDDEYQFSVAALAINKENTHLFSCGDFHIKIHDIKTYELLHDFEDAHEDYLTTMVLTPDSKLMVTGSDDLSIKVWDVVEREELNHWEHVHSDNIKTVAISSDKKSIISCCQKGSIKVLHIDEGLVVHSIHTQDGDTVMALAPEDQFLLTAVNNQVNFWDFESGKQFSKDKAYDPELFNGENKLCPNSKFFVHYDSFLQDSESQPVKVYDIESGEVFDLSGKVPYENTSYLTVSPNGRYVISYNGGGDTGFIIYDRQQDQKMEIQIYDEINDVRISPDNQYVIYATYDSIRFIDLSTQKECRVLQGVSEYQIQTMKVSPNGRYLVVYTTDWSLILVDLVTEEVFPFKGAHDNKIHDIAISFDGKFFASASQDTTIKVFDFETKQLVHKFVDSDNLLVNSICFSPDNRYIVSGFEDVKFYDLETKSQVLTITTNSKKDGYSITDLAISPNGQKLYFFPCKGWTGTPKIYTFSNSHGGGPKNITAVSDDKQSTPPPSEQDVISYSCFQSYYTKFNAIEDSLMRRNRPKAELFSKIIQSNFYILPYSWNILHIAAIDGNDNFIKDMPAYADFKISFMLDRYGKTPLHYLVAQEKITYSSVNIMLTYICDYLDDCSSENKHEYQHVIKALNPLCWFILLKCDIKLRVRFLNLCFVDSPTPFKMELPVFGEPTSTSAYFTQSPEVTPQIKETICEEGQNQIQFKTNLLYLDYDVTSEDMGKTIQCLIEQDSDDLFRSQIVSKLLNHLWSQAKPTLMVLFVLFSVFMICLSVYIALHERILAFEIVILTIAIILLVAEILQISIATLDYITDLWNVVDVVQILLTIAFIITRFTDNGNDLARSWMSTVIILAGYFRWVSYLRVFKPIRNFMQVFGSAVKDMFSFLVIIALIVIGFSICFVAFGIGNETATQWGPYGAYLYNAYSSFYGTIGDPDYGGYDFSQKLLIAVIAFLLNVILLNLLISILGESYGNSVATRDKAETLTKFDMILEAVTFLKFFNRKRRANVLRKSYLIYCFTSKSEEGQGNPEGEMEIRINKKFVDLKEDFAEKIENMESQFNEAKVSEEKLEKLTAQVAHLKEFYLRAIGIKEYADLKKRYKDFQRLEKKIEADIQKEDEDDEDEEENDEESVDSKK